ncbi:MAG: hypothetical protein ABIO24_12735 [Saprospiraceae bacterium]
MTNSLDCPAAARCAIAQTPDELDAVFQLRYLCYQRRGAIAEREDQRFRDSFDDLPN